jgi:polar amino acid transport system permease protein
LRGLWTTIYISAASIVLGTIAGALLAVLRRAHTPLPRALAKGFIEILLALPVLVLLVWAYYCLPLILPIRLSPEVTAIIVLSLSLSAFAAETIRSGIEAIPRGQIEAAEAFRLSRYTIYRYIVFPQALRLILPALVSQFVTCIKLSTMASVIAVYEVLHTANNIVSRTFRPLEIYTLLALLFVALILPTNLLARRLEDPRWKAGNNLLG